MSRIHFRLHCLRMALTGTYPKDLKTSRIHYLRAAFLCWTIFDRDPTHYGLTHIILFPLGKNEKSVEYFDAESTKLITYRNSLFAFGRAVLA